MSITAPSPATGRRRPVSFSRWSRMPMRPAPRAPGDGRSLIDLSQRLIAFLELRLSGYPAIDIDGLTPVSGGNARKAWAFDLTLDKGDPQACIMLVQAG